MGFEAEPFRPDAVPLIEIVPGKRAARGTFQRFLALQRRRGDGTRHHRNEDPAATVLWAVLVNVRYAVVVVVPGVLFGNAPVGPIA
uniref:hypothetical protein n=1 Tax=Nocardia xishanensis TaxID=238964 RepID=UPI0012F481B6|nr:hypothetical protein [Nocardia xishanensis]